MTGPYSMMGYDGENRPFVKADVDTVTAKAEADARNCWGFLLLPHSEPHQHRAYRGVGPGEYEQVPTRIFVFSNLLNPEIKWIPSKDEIEAGRKLENG
jgi:hypothetical protein